MKSLFQKISKFFKRDGMKIVLITRTWNDFKIKDFVRELPICLDRIIVLVNSEREKHNYTQSLLFKLEDKILKKLDILYVEPWNDPSGVLNIGIEKAFEYKADQIIIISKEIKISKEEIKKMSKEIALNEKMLVVGCDIKAPNENFKKEYRGHCKDCGSDVLRVPWNTCAMWNAKLFLENVGAFHPVCDCTGYLGEAVLTEKQKKLVGKEEIGLKGMEDALSMALAIRRNPKLRLGMFWLERPLEWEVKKEKEHIEKMIRKLLVFKKYHEIFDSLPKLGDHIDNL